MGNYIFGVGDVCTFFLWVCGGIQKQPWIHFGWKGWIRTDHCERSKLLSDAWLLIGSWMEEHETVASH